MRRPSTSTITNVELNGASIELSIDNKMPIRGFHMVGPKKEKKGKGKEV